MFNGNTINLNEITISAGITQRNDLVTGQYRNVVQIIRHPNYNPSTSANDVALIQLDANLNFNANVEPILLSDSHTQASVGTIARVTGWGNTMDGTNPSPSDILQTLDMPIISRSLANNINTGNNQVFSTMIPFYQEGDGVSRGDSGGLASVVKNGSRYLIGCSSWGEFPKDEKPTIYTDLYDFRGWISSIVPLPSITGSSTVCATNTTFTLQNSNSTNVFWSVSPNMEIVSYNNNSVTVKWVSAPGPGDVSAHFNGMVLRKDVTVGPAPLNLEIYPDSSNGYLTVLVHGGSPPFKFYKNGTLIHTKNSSNPSYFYFGCHQGGLLYVTASHQCGTAEGYQYYYNGCYSYFFVYPNPSDTELFITNSTANNTRLTTGLETNNSLGDLGPITLELYDFSGNMVMNQKFTKRDGSPRLNVSHLKKGIYILKIKAKEVDETHQVIIK